MGAVKQGLPLVGRGLAIIMIVGMFIGLRAITMGYSGEEEVSNLDSTIQGEITTPVPEWFNPDAYEPTDESEVLTTMEEMSGSSNNTYIIRPDVMENLTIIVLEEVETNKRYTILPLPESSPEIGRIVYRVQS